MDTLPLKFWLDNAHFVIYVAAAFGFFATGWLNLDSYRQRRDLKILLRVLGFFALALWGLISSVGLGIDWTRYAIVAIEIIGVGLVMAGFYFEAMPVVPGEPSPSSNGDKKKKPVNLALAPLLIVKSAFFKLPLIGWLLTLIRIWQLAIAGRVKDLRGLRTAILFFLLARLISLAELLRESSNVQIFNLTKEYSYLWMLENLLLLVAAILLIKWVFYYISLRPMPQLFITFVAAALIIFVVSTVAFTGSLFTLSQKNSLESLKKSAAVFEFSLRELEAQTNLAAYSLSQRDKVVRGALSNSVEETKIGLGDPVKELNIGGAAVTNRGGEVLAVSGLNVKTGDSLVADSTVAAALKGESAQSFVVNKLFDVDVIVVRAAFPIVENAKVVGVTVTDYPIDQAFVERVKEVTDLDVSINSGSVHAATTFKDKNDRIITGTEITNDEVLKLINSGDNLWGWSGSEKLVDRPYLVAYRSLADYNNKNIGSLLVGQSKYEIVNQMDYAVKLTFLVAIALMIISLLPMYFISRSISKSISV